MNDELTLGDVKYISVKRAAEITQYSRDYIGQLCREGKVLASRIGRNWYVAERSILRHRTNNGTETPIAPHAAVKQDIKVRLLDSLSNKEEEKTGDYSRSRKSVYNEPARQPARLASDADASKRVRSAGASRRPARLASRLEAGGLAGGPLATYYSDDRPVLPQLVEKEEAEDKKESFPKDDGRTVRINVVDSHAGLPTKYIDKKPALSSISSSERALIIIMFVAISLGLVSTAYVLTTWSGTQALLSGGSLKAFDQTAGLVNTTIDNALYDYLYASLLDD